MKKYYAAENHYGSDISHGFYNTWYIMAFDSKAHRDEWVESRNTLTAQPIKREHCTDWLLTHDCEGPHPFTRERWILDPWGYGTPEPPEGFVGTLTVDRGHCAMSAIPFYN